MDTLSPLPTRRALALESTVRWCFKTSFISFFPSLNLRTQFQVKPLTMHMYLSEYLANRNYILSSLNMDSLASLANKKLWFLNKSTIFSYDLQPFLQSWAEWKVIKTSSFPRHPQKSDDTRSVLYDSLLNTYRS